MRTAIVTGASRGIGRALSEAAATTFDALVTIGRAPSADLAAEHLASEHLVAEHLMVDLGASAAGLGERLLALCPVAHATDLVFFDVAAVLAHGALGDDDFLANMQEALAVNFVSPLTIARSLVVHATTADVPLTLIHVTSGAAKRPIEHWGAYCISKAAAVMAYRMIETEFQQVRVVIVDPGAVDTAMQGKLRALGDAAAGAPERLVSPAQAATRILSEAGFV